MKKSAFTMLELIMVIVVLGILAALAMPRLERDLRQEAGDNILSAIRYTQHMALMDNKTNPNSGVWQRALWQIDFTSNGGEWFYRIGSDSGYNGTLEQAEAAIDPTNGRFMHSDDASPAGVNESPDIFLTDKYGINGVNFNGCTGTSASGATHIAFDYLGRPHRGVNAATNDFGTFINNNIDCRLTFTFIDTSINSIVIIINQETGYAQIEFQPNA